jgi:hypothetical protein
MDSAKNQLIEKLHSATNILVTVSRDPSVDQLAACIGLTLLLNKLNKHATAVFSGAVPSTIEFLQPEETLEKNTDSLRDFIIALDKSKADKLRYKVEDEMVRIFITPYRTSISQNDLEFSQGDFNVDLVVAIGVRHQEDLDQAITSHGRILHDATVTTINLTAQEGEGLGSINWSDPHASSLSELVADAAHALGPNLLDGQLATALLTGIVAETHRFSNEKTTPQTMSVSAELMAAGANQQLVATKLDEAKVQSQLSNQASPDDRDNKPSVSPPLAPKPDDGTLEIEHQPGDSPPDEAAENQTEKADSDGEADTPTAVAAPADDEDLKLPEGLELEENDEEPTTPALPKTPKLITEPPTLGGTLTANSRPEALEPSSDPLSLQPLEEPTLLSRQDNAVAAPPAALPSPAAAAPQPSPAVMPAGFTPPPPAWVPPSDDALSLPTVTAPPVLETPAEPASSLPSSDVTPPANGTLTEIEGAVHSQHADADIDSARDEVLKALSSETAPPPPIAALNAQPLGDELHPVDNQAIPEQPAPGFTDTLQRAIPSVPVDLPNPTTDPGSVPATSNDGTSTLQNDQSAAISHSFSQPQPLRLPAEEPTIADPNAPPPVPPPIPFRFGNSTEPPRQ